MGPSSGIWVGGVPQAVADEIESEDRQDDKESRGKQPRMEGNGLDVLGFLEQDTPTCDGRTQPQAKKAEGGLGENHGGQRQGQADHDVARKSWQQVAQDDAGAAGSGEQGGGGVVLFTQR